MFSQQRKTNCDHPERGQDRTCDHVHRFSLLDRLLFVPATIGCLACTFHRIHDTTEKECGTQQPKLTAVTKVTSHATSFAIGIQSLLEEVTHLEDFARFCICCANAYVLSLHPPNRGHIDVVRHLTKCGRTWDDWLCCLCANITIIFTLSLATSGDNVVGMPST